MIRFAAALIALLMLATSCTTTITSERSADSATDSAAGATTEVALAVAPEPVAASTAEVPVSEQNANETLLPVIVISVEDDDLPEVVGQLHIAEDGHVVYGDGPDGSLRGTEPFVTWNVGDDGYARALAAVEAFEERAEEAFADAYALGIEPRDRAAIPATFSGQVAVVNSRTRIRFDESGRNDEPPSSTEEAVGVAFLELWENLRDPDWFEASTEPVPWTPHRILWSTKEYSAKEGRPYWPLDVPIANATRIDDGNTDWLCTEGEDAAVLWQALFEPGVKWGTIMVNDGDQGFNMAPFVMWPGVSSERLPATCPPLDGS